MPIISLVFCTTANAQLGTGGTFFASLSGEQEVPSVDTLARGEAILHLSEDGSELSFQLIVSRLEGVTQAHIHCGPAGMNGPVAVFLFSFVPEGVDISGVLSADGVTDADVIALPDSTACPGGVSSLADVIEQVRSRNAYVNVHTIDHPSGEIRGQLRVAGPRMRDRR
jgi:hypothetical protein